MYGFAIIGQGGPEIAARQINRSQAGIGASRDGVFTDQIAPNLELPRKMSLGLGEPAQFEERVPKELKHIGNACTVAAIDSLPDAQGFGKLARGLGKVARALRNQANAVGLDACLLAVRAEFLDRPRQCLLGGLQPFLVSSGMI